MNKSIFDDLLDEIAEAVHDNNNLYEWDILEYETLSDMAGDMLINTVTVLIENITDRLPSLEPVILDEVFTMLVDNIGFDDNNYRLVRDIIKFYNEDDRDRMKWTTAENMEAAADYLEILGDPAERVKLAADIADIMTAADDETRRRGAEIIKGVLTYA